MDVEIRLLRHAKALAEHGSFVRAARTLGITQPALTRSIQVLERRVGASLFVRGTDGNAPTDAGRVFLDLAAEVLSRSDELVREMNLLKGLDRGDLAIGVGIYPTEMFVGAAIARLAREHPGIRLRSTGGNWSELTELVRKRMVDFAIADAAAAEGDSEFSVSPLHVRQGYFLVRGGHPLLALAPPTIEEIGRFPIVASTRLPPALVEPIARAADRAGAVPAIACESLTVIKTVVAESDTVGILPLCVAEEELDSGRLAALPLVEPWLRGRFAVLRLVRRGVSPAAEAFLRILEETEAASFALDARLHTHWIGSALARRKAPRGRGAERVP
jgi:DNA-binding transcriptional LysR family regulator